METLNEFIKNNTGTKLVHNELRLRKDLGIDGDDAIDFLNAFSERFKVDISTLDFHEIFHEEGSFTPFAGLKSTKRDLTIADLQKAITLGKLV